MSRELPSKTGPFSFEILSGIWTSRWAGLKAMPAEIAKPWRLSSASGSGASLWELSGHWLERMTGRELEMGGNSAAGVEGHSGFEGSSNANARKLGLPTDLVAFELSRSEEVELNFWPLI